MYVVKRKKDRTRRMKRERDIKEKVENEKK